MFQHFIITRFNLRRESWNTTRTNTVVLTEEWMDNRLKLFENFCYASIEKQRNQNFEWLVFFDKQTDVKHKEIIKRLEGKFPNFKAIFIDGMEVFLSEIKKEITARLCKPYLITSRLDNDDALSDDYIDEVQKQFQQQNFLAIDYIDGFTLQVEPEVKLGKRSHAHNPFISLIERVEDFQTVWSRERHGRWCKEKEVKSIRNNRLWMSIIHSENKANDFVGFGEVAWRNIEKFNIDKTVLSELKAEQQLLSEWKMQSTRNQLRTYWKVTFKLLKRRFKFNF